MADVPHYQGHRQRLRERFRQAGFDGFQEYEVLELLLTYALPRRDVKPLAKDLLASFGSLQRVLDASMEELQEKGELTESSATFLHILKATWTYYHRQALKAKTITNTSALLDYCQSAMAALPDEQFRVIFLNPQNEIIADETIGQGTVDHIVVYPRKVMERSLYHKATAIILVHNHPAGAPKPSREDKMLTAEIARLATGLRIHVLDHLIVSRSGYYSFLESGDMKKL